MFKNYFIISILIFLVSCSDSAYFDPGPCPRAAILKGSETKEIDRSDLVIELNRTIMICEYNLRRKNINFDVGIFGDVINSDTVTLENLRINLFIAFVGPDDTVIDVKNCFCETEESKNKLFFNSDRGTQVKD